MYIEKREYLSDAVLAKILRGILENNFGEFGYAPRVSIIKLIRAETGCGLREAKECVDRMFGVGVGLSLGDLLRSKLDGRN